MKAPYLGGCVDCIYECKDKDEAGRLRGVMAAVEMVKTKHGQRAVCTHHARIHRDNAATREAIRATIGGSKQ